MGRKPTKLPTGVHRRGGKYLIWWMDSHGKRQYREAGSDVREASRLREELARNARRSKAGIEDEILQQVALKDLRAEYIDSLRMSCKPKWVHDVDTGLTRILGYLKTKHVAGLRKQDLEAARKRVVTEGQSNRTANKIANFVLALLRWAEETGRIARNPVQKMRPLPVTGKHQRKTRHRLTAEEAVRLQEAADDLRVGSRKGVGSPIGDLVSLILHTAVRLEEALSLQWSEVTSEHIRILASKEKSSRGRQIPLPQNVAARLTERKSRSGILLGRLPTPSDYVFLSPRTGAPMTVHGSSRCLKWLVRALEMAGLPRVYPDGSSIDWHALRHTACCLLLEGGGSTSAVQGIMGHKTPSITMDVYADLDRTPMREAIDGLPNLEPKKRQRKTGGGA